MKDFVEKCLSTRRKKTIPEGNSEKLREKMVSTSQKISCPLARICFFFENYVFLILINKILLINNSYQKTLSPLEKKSVPASRTKNLLKNTFSLYGKAASKILENWCPQAGIKFTFKNWLPPNFNNNFH